MTLTFPPPVVAPRRVAPPFAAPHLVGIGGSGMKSLGELLSDLGCRVTGSDQRFPAGHCETNVPADCDALVYSPAIPADNPERQAAAALAIPQFSLVDVLALLMRDRTGVCIAGTHGKSTTTALTAWILKHAGREPSAFIGASVRNQPAGAGEHFVVESCEYRRHFLKLAPQHAVILNIEPDHFDTFPNEAALLDGFRQFAARVAPSGTLLVSGDCQRSKSRRNFPTFDLRPSDFRLLESFGADNRCDWRYANVRQTELGTQFDVLHNNRELTQIESPLFGTHNLHNALAAVALCSRLGVAATDIAAAVREFPGITRRFAPLGEWKGISVFDDYAHHPTAVRVTLETARQRFIGRRVWCVFQPHQLLRTLRLLEEFAAALSIADRVLITPVFAAREISDGECERVSRLLAERVSLTAGPSCRRSEVGGRTSDVQKVEGRKVEGRKSKSRNPPTTTFDSSTLGPSTFDLRVRFCPSLDHVLPTLDDEARPGDVLILMGAGDIERIAHELAGRISGDPADQ